MSIMIICKFKTCCSTLKDKRHHGAKSSLLAILTKNASVREGRRAKNFVVPPSFATGCTRGLEVPGNEGQPAQLIVGNSGMDSAAPGYRPFTTGGSLQHWHAAYLSPSTSFNCVLVPNHNSRMQQRQAQLNLRLLF